MAGLEEIFEDDRIAGFDLREVASFNWIRVSTFESYTPVERVKEATGLQYRESLWQDIYTKESRVLLVFTSDSGPSFIEVPDQQSSSNWGYFDDSIVDAEGVVRKAARFTLHPVNSRRVARLDIAPGNAHR